MSFNLLRRKARLVYQTFAAVALVALTSHAHGAMVQYGSLADSEQHPDDAFAISFAGTGIPTDQLSYVTIGDNIVLALAATQRFGSPPIDFDNAGNYTAKVGTSSGGASTWNFSWYFATLDGSTFADSGLLALRLQYDVDPSVNTNFGTIDFATTLANTTTVLNPVNGEATQGQGLNQGSQNLTFGFLYSGIPGIVIPPLGGLASAIDPNMPGQYDFTLQYVFNDGNSTMEDQFGIRVNAVNAPAALGLFGLAIALLVGKRRISRH